MAEIIEGAIYKDLDFRSYYDITSGGQYPIPKDYEGPISQRQRRVRVISSDHFGKVLVENIHNRRKSSISVENFLSSKNGRRGFVIHSNE